MTSDTNINNKTNNYNKTSNYNKTNNKKNNIVVITIVAICWGFFILLLKPWVHFQVRGEYNDTWQLVFDGKYESARDEFRRLDKEYYGKTTYSHSIIFSEEFCKVCKDYADGDYRNAKSWMDYKIMPELQDKSRYPKLTKEQNTFVWNMVNAVDENYTAHKAEYDEEDRLYKEQQAAERQQKAAEEAARKQEAPYVGMSESKIDTTDLGVHTKYIEHFNKECISGEFYSASMYYWYSGGNCIYSARCVKGKVYNVWDNRDLQLSNGVMDHSGSSTSSSSSSKKKKNQESTTEFDPDDHDIEQYYLDYEDEFEDIDDAYDDFEDNPEYWDDY